MTEHPDPRYRLNFAQRSARKANEVDADELRSMLARIETLRAELAQAKAERDKFEAESEQKGADLMGCEGMLQEAEARVKELEAMLAIVRESYSAMLHLFLLALER